MKKYLEVVSFENNEVVQKVDVTRHSERQIERVYRGMQINLNHNKYFVRETEEEAE